MIYSGLSEISVRTHFLDSVLSISEVQNYEVLCFLIHKKDTRMKSYLQLSLGKTQNYSLNISTREWASYLQRSFC